MRKHDSGVFLLVAAAAENHQQVLEHEDEIQIKRQRSDNSAFSNHGGIQSGRLGNGHGFEFLGVIGGQPGENQYADITDDHLHGRAAEKYIDHGGDQNSDHAHK